MWLFWNNMGICFSFYSRWSDVQEQILKNDIFKLAILKKKRNFYCKIMDWNCIKFYNKIIHFMKNLSEYINDKSVDFFYNQALMEWNASVGCGLFQDTAILAVIQTLLLLSCTNCNRQFSNFVLFHSPQA